MIGAMRDVRCVACGGSNILLPDSSETVFACHDCRAGYGRVWGVPFLGSYEADDILGLIEIAANTGNRGKFGVIPEVVEGWERLLAAYHDAADKPAFVKNNPEAQSPFLPNRYGEWVEVAHLARGIDLQGSDVLDIGAGLGFDSHRLAMRGAKVTALEFSPLLAEAGNINFPHIRWVGGFSHVLPFRNGSFDAVFCNAALHHMRDIPSAISEALRVLRPGGYLVTTCDSFCPSTAKDDAELEIFDTQPAVLLGVNEGIPRFSEFVSSLKLHPELLDVELFTHTLYNAPSGGTLTELSPWSFARDSGMLSKRSGSLAMRVRLKAPWPEPAKRQADAVLTPTQYAEWLTSESSAIAKLASLVPDGCIDLPFPGDRGSKFELLNGWRLQKPFQYARTAYRRGRWFLRRPETADALVFEAGLPNTAGAVGAPIQVLLDGHVIGDYQLAAGAWSRVLADVSEIRPGQVFTVEIRKLGGDESLDGAAFVVRNRRFIVSHGIDEARAEAGATTGEYPTVFAVIPVFNRLHFTLGCIEHLKAQNYPSLRIIVADGGSTDGTIQAVRETFPDVVVLTSEAELWWAGSMAAGIDHALRESRGEADFVLMMNNDTEIPPDYVATLVAASQSFDAAVGALVADSRDATRVLDAGEYVVWSPYSFPVKTNVDPSERFCDDVDVLPGRGSLIPLSMIRTAGNVDARRFPHYLADYEFFYRLKRKGFRLGVSYETRVLAHIEETGILPGVGVSSFATVWRELFSRRSMSNVVDHWRFVSLHAPDSHRTSTHFRLIGRTLFHLGLRTPLRPLALPLLWCLLLPYKVLHMVKGQARVFRSFAVDVRMKGADVLCHPHCMPGAIRPILYLLASPGPVNSADCEQVGLDVEDLVAQGLLRPLWADGWFAFSTVKVAVGPVRRLLLSAWNPLPKTMRTLTLRQGLRREILP